MKKFLVIILITFLFACNSTDEGENGKKDSNKNVKKDTATTEINKNEGNNSSEENKTKKLQEQDYKHLAGTINGIEVEADIFKKGNELIFVYYYKKVGEPITLSGKIDNNNEFLLKEMVLQGKAYESFKGSFTEDGKFLGKWKKESKEFDFVLQEATNSVKFQAFYFAKTVESKEGTKCDDDILFYYPVSNKKLQEQIKNKYEPEIKEENPEEFLKKMNEKYVKEFMQDPVMDWNQTQISDIIYNANEILTYAIHWNAYSGGAHGNYSSSFYVFDVNTGKQIALNEILTNTEDKKLQDMIFASLKKQRNYTDEDMQSVFTEQPILPNKNFYVNKSGIGFHYNAYDIAPYSEGEFDVFIKFKDIKGLVNQEFIDKL